MSWSILAEQVCRDFSLKILNKNTDIQSIALIVWGVSNRSGAFPQFERMQLS